MTPAVLLTVSAEVVPEWHAFIDGWHDFFLLAGTAAVTLTGLLFVSISLHIDALIHATREHLLGLARAMLMSFVVVMTLSLMMLVPNQSMRLVAVEVIVIGLVGFAVTLRQLRLATAPTHHHDFTAGLYRRRLMFPLAGYAWLVLTGASLLAMRIPEFIYWIVGAVCMLLGNAAGSSWDLLVRVARIRAADAKDRAGS